MILAMVLSLLQLSASDSLLQLSASLPQPRLGQPVVQLQKQHELELSDRAQRADADERSFIDTAYDLPFNSHELLCGLGSMQEIRDHMLLKWSDSGGVWKPVPLGSISSTCSVVGNSGVLKNYKHGDAIDRSEQVFRFNDAPAGLQGPKKTGDYKAMVGVKEDVRLVNDLFIWEAGAYPQLLRKGVKYIFWKPVNVTIMGLDDLVKKHPGMEFYQVRHDVVKHLSDVFSALYERGWWADWSHSKGGPMWTTPSTGAIGMVLALTICKEIRAYGLAATRKGLETAYHYYEVADAKPTDKNRSTDKGNDHAGFFAEKDLWRRIANSKEDLDSTDVALIPGFTSLAQGPACQSREVVLKAGSFNIPVPQSLEDWLRYLSTS